MEISAYPQLGAHAKTHAMEEWRKRLSDRMTAVGMSAAELTRAASVGPTMIHDILNRGANPSVQNLSIIAKALGTTLAFLFEGTKASHPLSLVLYGVNKGGDMVVALPSHKEHVVPLDLLDENSVFVRVDSDSFGRKYGVGDVIGGPKIVAKTVDNLVGQECIICTIDAAHFIRFLNRGSKPNRYNLRSFDPTEEDVKDVQIAWVAPVKFIFRA